MNKDMNKRLIFLILSLCMCRTVFAETLTGTLLDDGEPVGQATVSLIDMQSNLLITSAHTDSDGRYQIIVKPGSYKLRASKEEYADQWIKRIVVRGKEVNVDITMTPQVFVDSTVVPESDGCD